VASGKNSYSTLNEKLICFVKDILMAEIVFISTVEAK
jgi:hypothetical protein